MTTDTSSIIQENMIIVKSKNRTTKKDPNNRGQFMDAERLCSVWQGRGDSNPRPLVLETNALTN